MRTKTPFPFSVPESKPGESPHGLDIERIARSLGVDLTSRKSIAASVPFSVNDVTAGSECEYQAVVIGDQKDVDLPVTIKNSNYFKNLKKRALSGETSEYLVEALDDFIHQHSENVWENSWVRFPAAVLSPDVRDIFNNDLLADKKDPDGPVRKDAHKFSYFENGELFFRIPVSYLLKLSLAESVSKASDTHPTIRNAGFRFMEHFLNDNTSPETFSFSPVRLRPNAGVHHVPMGKEIARETMKRFLLVQLLIGYANQRFELIERGQEAAVYLAPHPPIRQKQLNDLVPDSFYRELFMSPCLSGWDCGEKKHEYMHLCHQVLSRSQLNAVAKLREAGVITRNLVVLPNPSNISLANNGMHVSIGSQKLAAALKDSSSGFSARDEKYIGDLVIKIVEHFLPLFVNTYSAAPYRLGFQDFHPENVLGFLPHELDFTHLRMIWRRWKKKARLTLFGNPVTPFGPKLFDRWFGAMLGLKGDFIPDFRLIDYPVALLSTDESPGLNGVEGNDEQLKQDLSDFGVFDSNMAVYMLYRLRICSVMGFSGFEGRFYSLFEDLWEDMGNGVSMQTLITALAYQYIFEGTVTHQDIPDTPSAESERRQIFFGTAIDIPTFFVRKDTPNRFLARILTRVARVRNSTRYPGYLRIYNKEYRKALIAVLQEDASELIDMMKLGHAISDLSNRVETPETHSAAGKLTRGILDSANVSSPMKLKSTEFNHAAERYYRENLRKSQMKEAYRLLQRDVRSLEFASKLYLYKNSDILAKTMNDKCPNTFLARTRDDILNGSAPVSVFQKVIHLTLLSLLNDLEENGISMEQVAENETLSSASVY